jgi:hypothetical protein
MAERSDISINYNLNPRLLTVAKPSTSLTVQDLIDTCRNIEDNFDSVNEKHLINASGKEDLGSGVSVGITANLQNTKIAFESRNDKISVGVVTSNNNGTLLINNTANFITDNVQAGDTIINYTDLSLSVVLRVDSAIQLFCTALNDGVTNTFLIGDEYKIYHVAQCELAGGNIVAVDNDDNSMNPLFPTAFTQIIKTSSSSATLQEFESFQSNSFNGRVCIDIINGSAGVNYPQGTCKAPVNNILDAITVCQQYGIKVIHIIGVLVIGNNTDISGYTFNSDRSISNSINIIDAVTNGTFFENLTVEGTMNGVVRFTYCVLKIVNDIQGGIKNSLLTSSISFAGSGNVYIVDVNTFIVNDNSYREIKVNNAVVNFMNCTGMYKIMNKTVDKLTFFGSTQSEILVDVSCTSGHVHLEGIGSLTENNSIGTCTVHNKLISNTEIWNQEEAKIVRKMLENKVTKIGNIITIYEDDNTTTWRQYDLTNDERIEL